MNNHSEALEMPAPALVSVKPQWASRYRRIAQATKRAGDLHKIGERSLPWIAFDVPTRVQEREGLAFTSVVAEMMAAADRVIDADAKLVEWSRRWKEDPNGAIPIIEVWSEGVKAAARQSLLFVGRLDAIHRSMTAAIGATETANIIIGKDRADAKDRFDFFRAKQSVYRLSAAFTSDVRYSGKLASEVRGHSDPTTETDRVRRARKRKAAGFERHFVNVHSSDIEALVRMGFVLEGETDKTAIEAGVQAFVSAAFTLANGAPANEALQRVAASMEYLNGLEESF